MAANYLPCPCAESIGDPLVAAPTANPCVTEAQRLGRQTQQISCMDGVVVDSCMANLGVNLVEYWKSESVPNTGSVGSRILSNGGDVTSVAGKIANGWNFPGTANSFLSCPDDAALRLSGVNFTVRLWVFLNAFHATKAQTLLKKLDHFAGGGWTLRAESLAVDAGGSITFYQVSTVGGSLGTPVLIPAGQWVHVVFVHGDVNRIYANAVAPTFDGNQGPDSGTADLYIGQDDQFTEDATFTRFVGKIDEVLISTSPWTQADVTCDYNAGSGRTYPFA